MKILATLAAAATAAILTVAPAWASQNHSPLTRHDRNVIRFFQHHPRLAGTPAGGKALATVLPHVILVLRTVQAAAPTFPPHHALWICIARYESGGDPASAGNGHYGLLAMHPGWGWGTSYYANADSQPVQEWAAEHAWQASGYSYSFLYGQWYEWDAADGCGTTG